MRQILMFNCSRSVKSMLMNHWVSVWKKKKTEQYKDVIKGFHAY